MTALGGFCHSISLGVVSFVLFPSLVRLSSSSHVYLFLFWNFVKRILAVGSYFSDFRVIRACL